MSRFPLNYSPNIVYDNACKVMEFGLNRETHRFMELPITIDKFHQNNHTSCGESFKSSEYLSLKNANTQAWEQTNAKLRRIASSCTFMNPDLFMRSLSLYLGYQNIVKSDWVSISLLCFYSQDGGPPPCSLMEKGRWEPGVVEPGGLEEEAIVLCFPPLLFLFGYL